MKNHAILLLLSTMLVAPAFAGGDIGAGEPSNPTYDSSVLAGNADFASRSAEIIAKTKATIKYAENVAMINQINSGAHETLALIDQSGGNGNVAAIIQDGRLHSASAVIFQVGSSNRAIINQH